MQGLDKFFVVWYVRLRAVLWKYGVIALSLLIFFGIAVLGGCGSQDNETDVREELDELLESQETATPAQTSLPTDVAATVNGRTIPAQALAERLHVVIQEMDNSSDLDQYTLNRLRETALTELIENALIAQKARELKITVTDDELQQVIRQVQEEYNGSDIQAIVEEQGKSYEFWLKAQQETLLREKVFDVEMASMIAVTPEEVQQYYERNQEKYDHPAQARASQILVYDKSIAEKALQEIQQGADFAQIAQKYSESEDAQNGGDLGFFARGVMPPEFDEVIFSLKTGEVSNIVQTPYGYQIFKLTGEREAERIAFNEVKDQIAGVIKQQKRMMAIDLWLLDLQNNAKIVLNHQVIKEVN
ncbi:parvulin-like peptidyl-prolyl isomerase [Candidatus Vecturithrix granuli]|uniref:Parvulin-like peptidyl-prolyl isomerase n=1 Tax=Vecturithrix granuli TaxID=1499967 RepID=A0A081C453_VECG1|nr:parvulin-like peptidyl-prolyl isomerase [Candidatus Vecturithrix granuli]